MHAAMKANPLRRLLARSSIREETALVTATLGAFYGETVRGRIGGQWQFAEFRGARFASWEEVRSAAESRQARS